MKPKSSTLYAPAVPDAPQNAEGHGHLMQLVGEQCEQRQVITEECSTLRHLSSLSNAWLETLW